MVGGQVVGRDLRDPRPQAISGTRDAGNIDVGSTGRVREEGSPELGRRSHCQGESTEAVPGTAVNGANGGQWANNRLCLTAKNPSMKAHAKARSTRKQ